MVSPAGSVGSQACVPPAHAHPSESLRRTQNLFTGRIFDGCTRQKCFCVTFDIYRTNQRLEKVNERLTEENKILKAENKDYSLLRKVFGRKQIDDLLEQARTVKGRKRDNTRSR